MTDLDKIDQFDQYGRLAAKNLEKRLKENLLFNHRNIHCQFERSYNSRCFIQIMVCYRRCTTINLDNWWLTDKEQYVSGDIQQEAYNRLIDLYEKIKHFDTIDTIICDRYFPPKNY
jgi:hypothetical protein